MSRVEFSKKVRIEIFKRAGGPGDVHCEQCDINLMGKDFEIDHTVEEWELEHIERGYREPLTAKDGKLLCIPCHDFKSGKKAGERAHCNRLIEKAAKVKSPSRPIPGSKASGWKKPFGKPAERRA